MRHRLLERGAAALADYEILEMLLFLGIERRDTKPFAKGAINRFGSFAAVFQASDDAVLRCEGMTREVPGVLALVREAASCLAMAEATARPVLGDLLRLGDYLARAPGRDGLRALYLDSKNRLVADEMVGEGEGDLLRRALGLHAAAVIVAAGGGNVTRLAAMRAAAAKVAVAVHDWVVHDGEGWVSLASGRPF